MTTNINGQSPARTSLFRAAPLPDPPGAPASWPDRASRVRDQGQALDMLLREDLSRGRALVLCAGVVTMVAGLVPAMMIDAAAASSDTSDVQMAGVLGLLLLAVPALLLLRALPSEESRDDQTGQQSEDGGSDIQEAHHVNPTLRVAPPVGGGGPRARLGSAAPAPRPPPPP
ncbi:hypothetical protein ACFYQT_31805 [Streptomyces tibetensis]|uniref:Integral membrane protein n=1 Tax=Streptomyces tibetensis TaxID=2382123 RepID=A0ABW6N5E1_9ACTN